jgi:YD repeat-containing protein
MVFDETEPQTTFHKGSRHIYKYLKLHTPKGLRVCITDADGGTVHFGTC